MIVPEGITTHNQLGRWGESYVWAELQHAGYDVQLPLKGDGYDLLVGGLRIEVKTAAQGHDRRYRFCLSTKRSDHRHADVVILLAVSTAGLITSFVVPVEALTLKDNITLPKLRGYRGKYAEYRKPILKGLTRWMH